uniref:Prenyl-dependent CAAX protease n=1 Tax=Rhizophora mucronata TaxID=61149 RepID=A0A2P2K5V1_RHIMU
MPATTRTLFQSIPHSGKRAPRKKSSSLIPGRSETTM